jgi:hypothetical protein
MVPAQPGHRSPMTGPRLSLSSDPRLERIRKSDQGNDGKWFAIFSFIGLAYRVFKVYRFGVKHPTCPTRVIRRLITHGFEFQGNFEFRDETRAIKEVLDEVKLFVICAWMMLRGNSVRYEVGFRWYHQTHFDEEFVSETLSAIETTPVLLFGSKPFSDFVMRMFL